MRKAMFKKMACTMCAVVCLVALSAPCMAAMPSDGGGSVEIQMVNISDVSCYLTMKDGQATADSEVVGNFGSDKCKVALKIQEWNGTRWVTIDSWSITEDGRNATLSGSVDTQSGKTYRAQATVTVWVDGVSESKTVTTASKTA